MKIMFHSSKENLAKKAWNEKYREETDLPPVHVDIPRIVEIFKKRNFKRVLDLGCGSGRHTIFLAQQGFEVYGIDISEEGIRKTSSHLKKHGLKAHLKVGDIYLRLPYSDNFFDAIVCIHTLHHNDIEGIERLIMELKRILKQKGLLFTTLHKRRAKKHITKERIYGIQFIAPRTYTILAGKEKGIPHYIFNQRIIKKEFKGFKSLGIWGEYEYCFLGERAN